MSRRLNFPLYFELHNLTTDSSTGNLKFEIGIEPNLLSILFAIIFISLNITEGGWLSELTQFPFTIHFWMTQDYSNLIREKVYASLELMPSLSILFFFPYH